MASQRPLVPDFPELVTAGKVKRVMILERYTEQIPNNDYLEAVSTPYGERRWNVRGSLHGIPLLIKNDIINNLDLGMDETLRGFSVVEPKQGENEDAVSQLISAGMIIFEKTQMTSPYGSSASSTKSLSTSFTASTLSTEIEDYLVTPATKDTISALRSRMNLVPQSDRFLVSQHCATVGPMMKGVLGPTNLLDDVVNLKSFWKQRPYEAGLPGGLRELLIHISEPESPSRPITLKLDPLTLTASDLQGLLQAGKTTSVEIVKVYLDQIQKHNLEGMRIRAIISTLPRENAIALAQELDNERATKGARGPMHGIPILVKDSILTPSLGMDTTCGSYALKGMKGREDAAVIKALVKAGMIVLAKTNLSEWGSFKETHMTAGWSPVGGQTQSPYVRGGVLQGAKFLSHTTPAGSSSGSGAGVAAGFCPVSIGTESDGSVVQPATRAALYGMKATVGSVDDTGVQGVGPAFMSLGGLAKSARDLANVMSILLGGKDFSSFLIPSWRGLRIGFVDPALWQPAPFVVEPNEGFLKQSTAAIQKAIVKIKAKGAKIEYPVPLITLAEITRDPTGVREMEDLVSRDVGPAMEEFLALLENPPVKNVRDIIEFNKKHADLELPPEHSGQQVLEDAINSESMTDEEYNHGLKLLRGAAISGIQKTFKDFGVDVIMGPADARFASVAACAGYPVASVPLGFADFNGRAFGMSIIAGAGREGDILRLMSAWEATFPEGRQPPPMLVNWQPTAKT